MTDRYENIHKALAVGPTPGARPSSRHKPTSCRRYVTCEQIADALARVTGVQEVQS